jgi:hypothetical protein
MARIINNPFGELSGKIGGVVAKRGKKTKPYLASMPTPTTAKPSAVQLLQRNKMTVVMDFLRPLQGLLRESFFPFQQNKSGFHVAKSYFLKEALNYVDGGYEINCSKALVSFGDLRIPEGMACEVTEEPYTMRITWADNSDQAMAYPKDRLMLVFYAPGIKKITREIGMAARRKTGEALVKLTNMWAGTDIHVWAGFQQRKKKRASSSVYLGTVHF